MWNMKSNLILLILIIMLLTGLIVYFSFVPKTIVIYQRYTCSDFSDQKSAQRAYNDGAEYLDGNHDKIACNILK